MMTTDNQALLIKEWCTLQKSYDQYEVYSLLVKLLAITLCILVLSFTQQSLLAALGCAILWLQDGIWKTFQSRFETRLLWLELAMQKDNLAGGLQFNQAWAQQRPSSAKLIKSYLVQSMRPTVAYPYCILMLVSGLSYLNIV